jgi:hypothetical protein
MGAVVFFNDLECVFDLQTGIRNVRSFTIGRMELYALLDLVALGREYFGAGAERGGCIFCWRRWREAGSVARILNFFHCFSVPAPR